MQQSAGVVEPDGHRCPLCGRTFHALERRPKTLYGIRVCGRCRNGFANRRQGAFLIDWVLVNSCITAALLLGESVFWGSVSPGAFGFVRTGIGLGPLELLLGFLFWPLFLFKDGFEGRSPGKRLLGIEVVDQETMQPIGYKTSFNRNLPLLPFLIIFPVLLLIPAVGLVKGARWGDGRAATRVVWRKYRHRLPFDQRGIFCQSCGYNLTGNVSGICSECGTPIPGPPRAIPVVPPPSG